MKMWLILMSGLFLLLFLGGLWILLAQEEGHLPTLAEVAYRLSKLEVQLERIEDTLHNYQQKMLAEVKEISRKQEEIRREISKIKIRVSR